MVQFQYLTVTFGTRPRLLLWVTVIFSLHLFVGCRANDHATTLMPTPLGLSLGIPHPGGDFHKSMVKENIPIFIVSGRNLEDNEDEINPFGTQRNHKPELGIAQVKIGADMTSEELLRETVTKVRRKRAKVELVGMELTPSSVIDSWLLKDATVRHQGDPWVRSLKHQLDKSDRRNVCIYVHGYNTDFVDNTLLAAEIFHYLGRDGAMVSFEWPSEARLLGYITDKGNATYSTRHFRGLVSNIAKECQAGSITIIAHSAGSPIVVNALRELRLLEYDMSAAEVQAKYRIDRIALAAPDMDLMSFVNAVNDRFYELTNGVAVYASPNDKALRLAQLLYKDERLGGAVGLLDAWEKTALQKVTKIEMIDVTKPSRNLSRKTSRFLGHNYFHRDPWISSDIASFLMGLSPQRRGLKRDAGGVFWAFPNNFIQRLQSLMPK